MPTLTFRRGRKIGDPNYSSTDVGLELEVQVDDDTFNDDATFAKFCDANYSLCDRLLEAEIARIYADRAPAAEPARERQREAEPATTRSSYRNGDGASHHDSTGNGNGYTKERREWPSAHREDRSDDRRRDDRDRSSDRDRGGDRGRGRDDRRGGGGSNRPPSSGKALFAWAKDKEERGDCRDLIKWLNSWAKRHDLPARFVDWTKDEVEDAVREVEAKIERGDVD